MSLHSVPPCAQRHPESIWESQGADAATSREWSERLEAALTAARREDLRTARMPHTPTAASAASVENTSVSGWVGAGASSWASRALRLARRRVYVARSKS